VYARYMPMKFSAPKVLAYAKGILRNKNIPNNRRVTKYNVSTNTTNSDNNSKRGY
ncbi:10295_t:CDS:1, partial [Ambispora leptoticha]